MKKIYYIITSLILLISSCTQEDLVRTEEQVIEGEPVRISININDAVLTRSGMSQSQEQAIKNIFVMVFDKTGTKVSQSYFSSNITSNLQDVSTVSGNNMSVYIVANLSPQNTSTSSVSNYFDNIYTLSELNQVMLYDLSDDLNVNRDLIMYGSTTALTISPTGIQTVSIQLDYAVAKVTLYVVKALKNPSDSYTLANWTILNYPQKSHLFPQATDAGTSSSDFAKSATSIAWVDTTLVINGVNTPAQYAFLYMYENRQGTNSNTTQTQKAGNAPANATAIVMQGYYQASATNTVTEATTTIHLGNNNYNDYNVNRGNNYAHIATVTGINEVNVDTRVVSNENGFQVNLHNTTLDCHADWRPLQINAWPGTATIHLYNSDGVTPCTWLHVSNINLNQAVNNARPTYNPGTDMHNTLVLNYPVNSPMGIASQMTYLYADENLSAQPRSAVITITTSQSPANKQIPVTQLGYQIMGNVGLRPFSSSGTINTSGDYVIAIENTEEISLNLTPGATPGTEALSTMQWGFNMIETQTVTNAANYYYRNGFENTLWLVYNNNTGAMNSALRPPYGRSSTTSAGVTSSTITENAMNPIFNTYPARYCFEKNRDLDGDGQISNPNTNGVNEINWYFPSADEMSLIGTGQSAYPNILSSGANYNVSTELYGSNIALQTYIGGVGTGTPVNKFTFQNVRCIRKLPQAPPVKTSPYIESNSRIINNSGFSSAALRDTRLSCPPPLISTISAANQVVSPRFVVAKVDCLSMGTFGGSFMSWSQAYGLTPTSDTSSTSYAIASPATGCNAYSEPGYPAGTWRLPTQGEMALMLLMRTELVGQNGYVPLASLIYYTASYVNNITAIVGCTSGGYFLSSTSKVNQIYARCVRDL